MTLERETKLRMVLTAACGVMLTLSFTSLALVHSERGKLLTGLKLAAT